MVLDQLTFLTKIHVENNRVPRRLIPKIRTAIKSFSDKRPKISVQYGHLIVAGVVCDWLNTINWIVEHYYTVQDTQKTSLVEFSNAVFCLTRTKDKCWVIIHGYDCDGFWISQYRDETIMDHAVVFIDGLIALKVESHDNKYFITDYFIGNMTAYNANKIIQLWYGYERQDIKYV